MRDCYEYYSNMLVDLIALNSNVLNSKKAWSHTFRRRCSLVVLHDHGPLRVPQTFLTPLLLHQQHLQTLLLLEETSDTDYTDTHSLRYVHTDNKHTFNMECLPIPTKFESYTVVTE